MDRNEKVTSNAIAYVSIGYSIATIIVIRRRMRRRQREEEERNRRHSEITMKVLDDLSGDFVKKSQERIKHMLDGVDLRITDRKDEPEN